MRLDTSALLLTLVLGSSLASAQSSGLRSAQDLTPNSDITLVMESNGLRVGATTTVALRITLDRGWHTYWNNPGDAGLPLSVQWTLPVGVTVSPLRLPVPHVLPQPPLMSYGYEREVFVLADVSVAPTVAQGTRLTLAADADFLVCADVCLPASARVTLDTRVTAAPSVSRWASAINETRARLVRPASGWQTAVWRDGTRLLMKATFPDSLRPALRAAYVIPDSADVLEHAAVQRMVIVGDTLVMAWTAARRFSDTTSRFSGVLLADVNEPTLGLQLDAPIVRAPPPGAARLVAMLDGDAATGTGGAAASNDATTPTANTAQTGATSSSLPEAGLGFWLALALAFGGGLILNLMPCVFPVLSIKILAFVERGGDDEGGRVGRRHALVFTLGVLATFWALAGVLLALRAGGAQLGWGFQLQSPAVVAVIALVVFALALNLSGVYTMGMSLTRLGAVGAGERYSDSFLTGLLAVVVATPCTAPFMGAALGYALTQPAAIGLAVFTALGLGLAAPYMLFASSPALLRKLPRPGPWLETLKQLLAFPLYATVVWLVWVLGRQAGTDQVALVLGFAVLVSLVGWTAGRAQNAGRTTRSTISLAALLVTIVAGGAVIAAQPAAVASASAIPAGWEPWSAARVAAARDSGRAVFVDFTAAWCLSCQVNERIALHTERVERAFVDGNVLLLRADWTSRDAEITAVLATFGRSGVPLYVMYPASSMGVAEILPAVLTPGMVVESVARATATISAGR
jgi:thiol:disulfide interchange protein/DsbC/DsbD-like thiol-disulfide interchange protein